MDIALRPRWPMEAFLTWEAQQETKFEFNGIQPVAMTGVTVAHAILQRNLAISVGGTLRGKRCPFYGSDLKIQVSGSIRYPDGFVVCPPTRVRDTVVTEPVVIFEILSPRTSRTDRIVKNQEYAATPSVCRYVMLEQDTVAAPIFARDDDDWVGHIVSADAILAFPETDIFLPLAELYDGFDFPVDPEAAD